MIGTSVDDLVVTMSQTSATQPTPLTPVPSSAVQFYDNGGGSADDP